MSLEWSQFLKERAFMLRVVTQEFRACWDTRINKIEMENGHRVSCVPPPPRRAKVLSCGLAALPADTVNMILSGG